MTEFSDLENFDYDCEMDPRDEQLTYELEKRHKKGKSKMERSFPRREKEKQRIENVKIIDSLSLPPDSVEILMKLIEDGDIKCFTSDAVSNKSCVVMHAMIDVRLSQYAYLNSDIVLIRIFIKNGKSNEEAAVKFKKTKFFCTKLGEIGITQLPILRRRNILISEMFGSAKKASSVRSLIPHKHRKLYEGFTRASGLLMRSLDTSFRFMCKDFAIKDLLLTDSQWFIIEGEIVIDEIEKLTEMLWKLIYKDLYRWPNDIDNEPKDELYVKKL